MAATKMFSKFKGSSSAGSGTIFDSSNFHHRQTGSINPIDTNPISQFFEIGKLSGSAGPELAWKIYDAIRKSDKKVRTSSSYKKFSQDQYITMHAGENLQEWPLSPLSCGSMLIRFLHDPVHLY